MNDGIVLNSIKHPRPPFWKWIWQVIKAWFVRPKFSKEALEKAEPLTPTQPAPPKIDLRTLNRHERRRIGSVYNVKIPGSQKPFNRKEWSNKNLRRELEKELKLHK